MPIKGVHQTSHYVPVHNQLHKTGSYFLENENAHMAIFQSNYNYSHPKGSLDSFLTGVSAWVNPGQRVKWRETELNGCNYE